MRKHKKNCKHCGQEFEPTRSDAMYCSNSCKTRASQIRSKQNPIVEISFEQHELEELYETAEEFDLSLVELIKYKSLLNPDSLSFSDQMVDDLELENRKLRAELSMHTKKRGQGIFLDLTEAEEKSLLNTIDDIQMLKILKGNLSYKIYGAIIGCFQLEETVAKLTNRKKTDLFKTSPMVHSMAGKV